MESDINTWTEEDVERAKIENRGLSMSKYIRGSPLGLGGWSVVYKTLRLRDGKVFAGKSAKTSRELGREAEILESLRHDHIVKFLELYLDPVNTDSTMLIMEFCPHGTLQTRIDQATPHMARCEVVRTIVQIAQALEYVHAQKMYHSDVKPRNILIRALHPIDVALADFADAKDFGQRCKLQGTPAYWSPEMKTRKRHCGPEDDMWALGITLLGMVGQWPQVRYTKKELEKYPERCFEHARRLGELNPDVGLVNLLGGLLAWEARRRMSAEECVRVARKLELELELGDAEGELGIKSPEEFRPISFW